MSDARKQTAPRLQWIAFTTSRLAEFCGEKELTAQTGHAPAEWPLVIAKELADNALDVCEEAEIAPEISIKVSTERGEIVIADNGPGLPSETLDGVLDYSVRVSSREAYVSPSRGQQGNALKCIIAMPFALDGTHGTTVIESRGQAHRIVFEMDAVRREPRILREIASSDVQNGTRITMRWPETACHLLEAARGRFVQMVCAFTTFNPHLTMRGRWNDEEFLDISATDPHWHKWRTCDTTSAHWYSAEQFQRYLAAHIARDEDQGRTGRTVRDFISELRGLARSDKQKLVLAETKTSGVGLATCFAGGPVTIAALLNSCQKHTKPVKPEGLGLIGDDHLLGIVARSAPRRRASDTAPERHSAGLSPPVRLASPRSRLRSLALVQAYRDIFSTCPTVFYQDFKKVYIKGLMRLSSVSEPENVIRREASGATAGSPLRWRRKRVCLHTPRLTPKKIRFSFLRFRFS